jgi:hypothetical protein
MRLGFKRFDVSDSSLKQADVILESTQSDVAALAQQAAHGSRGVAVVNSQVNGSTVSFAAWRLVADGTDAVLSGEHGVVVSQCDAVAKYQIMVLLFVECRRLIGKSMIHVRKMRVGWPQLSRTWVSPWVPLTRLNMQEHAFKSESSTAVLAGLEFPATGASFDSAEISPVNSFCVFFAPFVKSCKRTRLAFVVKSVNAGGVTGKFSTQFYLLASRAKSLFWSEFRKTFAQLSPMSAESFRSSFVATKAAFDVGFAGHGVTIS